MKTKTLKIWLPQSWDALSPWQLQRIATVLHTGSAAPLDVVFFLILMGCRWYTWRRNLRAMWVRANVPMSELRKHYAFLFTENTRTLFPDLKVGKVPYRGFGDISAEEFAAAEDLHAMWHDNGKPREALQYMAAVLYRFPGERFDRFALDERAKRFAAVPLPALLAMELAYSGSKAQMVKLFKHAFKESDGKGGKASFAKVITEMAGGKFGSYDTTATANIYTLLEQFNENLKPKPKTRRR